MAKINSKGEWENRNGKPIDPKLIPIQYKRRDKTVEDIFEMVFGLSGKLGTTKSNIIKRIHKYLEYQAKRNKVEPKDISGNIQLSNYNNTMQVNLSRNDTISFDENLNLAKALIDKCLKKWSKSARSELRSIITDAFNIDRKGRVNIYSILKLKQIQSRDKDWKAAMDLINKAQNIVGSKQYLQFRMRNDVKEEWQSLSLNFSSIRPL